jgi:hypothetical protein
MFQSASRPIVNAIAPPPIWITQLTTVPMEFVANTGAIQDKEANDRGDLV